MKWESVTLDKLGIVSRGRSKHRPRDDSSLYGGRYPFIQTADVKAAPFYITDYNETYNEKGLAQSKLWRRGTLCITIAANIADTAILDIDACFPDSVMGFIPYEGISDVRFIKYAFDMLQRDMRQISQGTAQDNLSWQKLSTIQFPDPPIEVQRRIADYLVAYENLIENNQKQIKLLEEAAQRLYKEWFVDLRFPGHENTPIKDGVPEGWERKKLIDIADVQYGFAFDGSLFNSTGIGMPIIRIRNIPDGFTSDYTSETADDQYIVKNGEIVVGMDGEFHINSWNGDDAYLVQRTCRIRPHEQIMNGWLLSAIYSPIKFFEKTLVGATVAHLGKKHIDTITLLVAPKASFYTPFSLLFDKRQRLLNQNRRLADARDRLLPKLMSGEIEV